MRLGPILVPSAIVVAIGVIVAAQSGWLDATGPEPTFVVHGDPAVHGASPAADPTPRLAAASTASRVTIPAVAAPGAEPTTVGRSIGKNGESPSLAASTSGSGGASLDSDGGGSAARDPDSGASADALQQARDEAAKAKQDVLEVTQASIAAQHASEAEFERQKAELNEQIAQLRTKAEAGSAQPAASRSAAEAEARAATATAELADARQRENALREKLAAFQSGGVNDAASSQATDKMAAAERALAEAQGRAKALDDKVAALQREAAADRDAAGKLAAAEQAGVAAQDRGKALEDKVAALQAKMSADKNAMEKALVDERAVAASRLKTASDKVAVLEAEVAAKAVATDKVSVMEHALADKQVQVTELSDRVAALKSELTENTTLVGSKIEGANRLKADLDAAKQREDALNVRVATMQAAAVERDARVKQAEAAASRFATIQQQLAAAQGREKDLGVKLAALQSEQESGSGDKTGALNGRSVATLQDDLAGARRGESTLRKENSMLQGELAQERTAGKLMGEKLAALQVGMTHAAPAEDGPTRRDNGETTKEHERLVHQLDSLKREQMRQQVKALKTEMDRLHPRTDRRPSVAAEADESARLAGTPPAPNALSPAERREARRRERQARRDRNLASGTVPAGGADDPRAVIAQSSALIQSGQIDQARQLLRQRGGAAATRALADTYNPLTNTQYGVIGVDSDPDKATYLYQQAARAAR